MDRLRKYRPGAQIRVVVYVQHHEEQRLASVELVFSNRDGADGELTFRGEPVPPEPRPRFPVLESEARVSLTVPGDATPGLYKLNRVVVETFAGTPHSYQGDELATLGEMVFEVVAEPEDKPTVRAGFLD